MNEPHELRQRALRWLRWAEEDLVTAQTLLDASHVVPRSACSAAHQAAEKALP
ncbi:MAG: HEPN domain-containing protein [Acidimicrobiia bacterium]